MDQQLKRGLFAVWLLAAIKSHESVEPSGHQGHEALYRDAGIDAVHDAEASGDGEHVDDELEDGLTEEQAVGRIGSIGKGRCAVGRESGGGVHCGCGHMRRGSIFFGGALGSSGIAILFCFACLWAARGMLALSRKMLMAIKMRLIGRNVAP